MNARDLNEDGPPCVPPRAASKPEPLGSVLRRTMLDVQLASDQDDVPGPTREHLNAAWRELRKAMASLPGGRR